MKKILLFISILSITSCNSSSEAEDKTQPENKLPPSAVSDALRSGYFDAVKVVYVSQDNVAAFTAEDKWIIKDSSEERNIYYFDTLGYEQKEEIYHKIYGDWKFADNITTTRNGNDKISTGKLYDYHPHYIHNFFNAPNMEVSKHYIISDKDTSLATETRTTYDRNYNLIKRESRGFGEDTTWTIRQFTTNGDTTFSTAYLLGIPSDTLKQTIIILEKDQKGNRTKVVTINDKTGNAEITLRSYEYYPPRK